MGFAPLAIGTGIGAAALGSYNAAAAQNQAAQAMKISTKEEASRMEKEAKLWREEAAENTYRARLNALGPMGNVRTDTARANIASTGTGAIKEKTLASRLEQDINDKASQALKSAALKEDEARVRRWDGEVRSNGLESQARGSIFSGMGQSALFSSRF